MEHPLASLEVTLSPVGNNLVEVTTNFGLALEGDFIPIAPWELELLGEPAGRENCKSASFSWLTPCCRDKVSRQVQPHLGSSVATSAACCDCRAPLPDVFLHVPSTFTGLFSAAALEAMGVNCGLDPLTAALASSALAEILEAHTQRRWAEEIPGEETFNLEHSALAQVR